MEISCQVSTAITVCGAFLSSCSLGIAHNGNVVAFGGLKFDSGDTNVLLQIKTFYNFTTPVCHMYGCTDCYGPSLVGSNVTISLSSDRIYLLAVSDQLMATAILMYTRNSKMSSDKSLQLMLNPFVNHSFVYYAASVDFLGEHLHRVHANDHSVFTIIALTNNTEVIIIPIRAVEINTSTVLFGEEYSTILDIGESLMVTSSEDLTGSRVTANKAISFYSGHYCATGSTDNCSVLIEQIPPFNSWGNSFILQYIPMSVG